METVEITKQAFYALIGDSDITPPFAAYTDKGANFFKYKMHGVILTEIYNPLANVTQYYITDINA